LRHEFVDAVEVGNYGPGFFFGEDSGNTFAFLGAEGGERGFVEGDLEDVAVEEEDGAEGLILGGFGDFSFDDEMCNELVDFMSGHLAGMDGNQPTVKVGVMIADVLTNPMQVGFFCAGGVLFDAELVTILVKKFFRCHK
jgi:hypothetical protein